MPHIVVYHCLSLFNIYFWSIFHLQTHPGDTILEQGGQIDEDGMDIYLIRRYIVRTPQGFSVPYLPTGRLIILQKTLQWLAPNDINLQESYYIPT